MRSFSFASAGLVCLLAARAAHADAAADAQALFDQGISDMKAGNFDQACKELNASLQKHADSGTKGALATCLTKINKVATAWQLWKDLVDTAPSADYKADAAKKVAELEPRLPHFVVKAAKTPGLVITVEDRSVDPSVSVPLPVDPGKFKVTATAPDYKEWTGEFTAEEGKTVTVDVPALVILPPDQRKKTTTNGIMLVDTSARHSRRQLAVGIAAAGGVSLAIGLFFGHQASSKFDDVKKECGGDINQCPGNQFMQANRDFNSAHTAATVSTVLVAIGAVVVIGGGVAWFTAPGEKMTAGTASLRVSPQVDQHGGGLVLSGGF